MHGADGDHGGVGGGDLARHDALQPHHGGRGHHDRVDGGLRPGPVTSGAVQRDPQGIGGGEHRAGPQPDRPGRDRCHVLAENDIRPGHPLEQPVGDHGCGAFGQLFGWLKHHHHGPGPVRAGRRQLAGRAEQARHVHVVTAGVHHAIDPARVGKPGRLPDRQGIHVRAQRTSRLCGLGVILGFFRFTSEMPVVRTHLRPPSLCS